MEKKTSKMNRRGMAQFLDYAVGFGIAIVGFVIVVILLQSLQTSSGVTAGSYAANITGDGLVFADNFSSQWGLAGTILGYVLVLAILALIGVGGYMGYQKVRGGR
jgi:hypothetical protein